MDTKSTIRFTQVDDIQDDIIFRAISGFNQSINSQAMISSKKYISNLVSKTGADPILLEKMRKNCSKITVFCTVSDLITLRLVSQHPDHAWVDRTIRAYHKLMIGYVQYCRYYEQFGSFVERIKARHSIQKFTKNVAAPTSRDLTIESSFSCYDRYLSCFKSYGLAPVQYSSTMLAMITSDNRRRRQN